MVRQERLTLGLIAVIAPVIVIISIFEVSMHIHLRIHHRWQTLTLDEAPVVLRQQVRIELRQHVVWLVHHDLALMRSTHMRIIDHVRDLSLIRLWHSGVGIVYHFDADWATVSFGTIFALEFSLGLSSTLNRFVIHGIVGIVRG